MNTTQPIFIVIVMLLFSPFAYSLPDQIQNNESNTSEVFEKSDNSYWKRLENPIHSIYEIQESSGLVHSPYGIFDPIVDDIPLGPWGEIGLSNPFDKRLHIVQSINSDLNSLEEQLNSMEIQIIDQIPDDALVISINEEGMEEYKNIISQLPQVRWIENMPSMWKVSPSLIQLINSKNIVIDLDIIPSPAISISEHESLSVEMSALDGFNHLESRCDRHICQIKSSDNSYVKTLASDYRVLKIELGQIISIQNSNASLISGIDHIRGIFSGNLTGFGEIIGISDTGLDADHGDFDGRLRSPIYNLFGPDNSGADTNSGHGTHVAATLLGDGSGDANMTGMVPESTFHFYQLEVDSSGLLARWGSLYEMFEHSLLNDAKIHTNSWGSESLLGDYTSDSRSVDLFTKEYPEFLAIFSVGDMNSSGVTSPSTSKNSLSVGSSTTGSFSSDAVGDVYNSSSRGPTSDGRIKPDLVAPGVMICSARAEEASLVTGGPCSSVFHDDGSTPKYMTLSGSSMATPVAAGASAMIRQYLREELGIQAPRSDLIRAILVNGADDLGQPDIPNAKEGWGQLNVSNSIFPQNAGTNQSVFFDQERQLLPGHSFIYTFELADDSGLDVSLAWNDREGSASADQNSSRLVNDLDLIVTSPNGDKFMGNDFVNGFSQISSVRDELNNLERIRIQSTDSGLWTVQVGHSGGFLQDYSIVISASAEETQGADLAVVPNSIYTSDTSPLKGDTISFQLSWINQAAATSGEYSISVEDISDGSVIETFQMEPLEGGSVQTFSFYHYFSSTGDHLVRLTLDYLSEVEELNDESSGINNNIFELLFEVREIGVRLTPLLEDGSHPSNLEESESAKSRNINPSLVSWATFEIELLNEGTSQITVELAISPMQLIDDSGILQTPLDEWSKTLSEEGPWNLSPFGESGDRVVINLNLTDEDADLDSQFALPGVFVTDLTLMDKMTPTISHSARLSVEVDRVEGIFTIPAGTESLGAEPDNFASFSLSVKNIGNGPTEYSISCETEDRWIVHVGSSQSSETTIGPLSRLQFVFVTISVKVPPSSSGLPAGATNSVTCVTTSVNDPSLERIDYAVVEILESGVYSTQIFDSSGVPLGPLAISESRAVLNGETISTHLTLSNLGNIPLDFQVRALSSSNIWPIQAYISTDGPPLDQVTEIEVSVSPGTSKNITIRTIVPLSAEMGDRNTVTVKTYLGDEITTNASVLEVKEITTLDIEIEDGFSIVIGKTGNSNIFLHNSGNVELLIELTMGTLPEGWSGGFLSGNAFSMDMNRDSVITVGMELPAGTPSGEIIEKVPVIIESTSSRTLSKQVVTVEIGVTVLPSVWLEIEQIPDNIPELQGIPEDEQVEFSLEVFNSGNKNSGVSIESITPEGWTVLIEPSTIDNIDIGESFTVSFKISPRKSSEDGLKEILIYANSTIDENLVFSTNSTIQIQISKSESSNEGGISGILSSLGLPPWSLAILFLFAIAGIVTLGVRARNEFSPLDSNQELIPRGSALQAGSQEERRAAALDTSTTGDVVTGDVSDSEIEEMLQSSIPTLPTHQVPEGALPLPLTGLPEGWTMEQWVAYGHIWWEQNGP